MTTNELYLKTAFCCMACDGNIADEEISSLRSFANNTQYFSGVAVQEKLDEYVSSINSNGTGFLSTFLSELSKQSLTEKDQLDLIRLSIQIIEADNKIEYSEVSFFKKIRKRMTISDNKILEEMPDKEDYLLPDVEVPEDYDWNVTFNEIKL